MGGEDLALVRGVAAHRSAALTSLAHAVSWLGRSVVLVPAALLLGAAAMVGGRRAQAAALVVGTVGAVILQNAVKAIVERPRPPVRWLEAVSSTSFPSGHATQATAFFVGLALVGANTARSRAARLALAGACTVIVVAVALSRVYLGVHYPTDVVAGALLGGAWALVSWTVLVRPPRPVAPRARRAS